MSFKQDDENLLKNLNHQRVKELLGTHIPQDEARLLSNGRLACMICQYRPIFDTVNMLAIHRKGKRHLLELSRYIKCQEDALLKDFQRKRHHMDDIGEEKKLVKAMMEPSLMKTFSHKTVLGSKHQVIPHYPMKYRRKPTLEINPTVSAKVPVFSDPVEKDPKSASATVRHYLKSLSKRSSLEKVVEKNRENYGIDLQKGSGKDDDPTGKDKSKQSSSGTTSVQESTEVVKSSSKETQDHEIKLRMDGWIKDSSGMWIKDPNVEFDSDEDGTHLLHS